MTGDEVMFCVEELFDDPGELLDEGEDDEFENDESDDQDD